MKLGADEVVVSNNCDRNGPPKPTVLDLIVNSVASSHNLDPFLATLRRDGSMVLSDSPAAAHPSPSVASLVGMRRSLAGSLVGGIAETQELLDFCAGNNVWHRQKSSASGKSRRRSSE